MHVKHLQFPFKGARQYIHSTSIMDAILEFSLPVPKPFGIDFLFKKKILVSCCRVELREPEASDHVVIRVLPNAKSSTPPVFICINPESGCLQSRRIPYDEDHISTVAVVSGCGIRSAVVDGFSDSEIAVALCKRLHLEVVNANRKWVFSRYTGRFPLRLEGEIELVIAKRLGERMTCTDLYSSGELVGQIYFV